MLNFIFAFDVVRKGYLLAYDKVLKITVTQLYKCKKIKVESAVPIAQEETWIIEVACTAVPQEQVNQMAEHLNKFKNLLIGVVDLEYVDTRALQNRIPYTN
ncbi:hypothetical protein G6F42_009664 [Rhizopus arrhizus]|nr:hypothetical protein G6F42_009664 [Rhizopus arrhizus]